MSQTLRVRSIPKSCLITTQTGEMDPRSTEGEDAPPTPMTTMDMFLDPETPSASPEKSSDIARDRDEVRAKAANQDERAQIAPSIPHRSALPPPLFAHQSKEKKGSYKRSSNLTGVTHSYCAKSKSRKQDSFDNVQGTWLTPPKLELPSPLWDRVWSPLGAQPNRGMYPDVWPFEETFANARESSNTERLYTSTEHQHHASSESHNEAMMLSDTKTTPTRFGGYASTGKPTVVHPPTMLSMTGHVSTVPSICAQQRSANNYQSEIQSAKADDIEGNAQIKLGEVQSMKLDEVPKLAKAATDQYCPFPSSGSLYVGEMYNLASPNSINAYGRDRSSPDKESAVKIDTATKKDTGIKRLRISVSVANLQNTNGCALNAKSLLVSNKAKDKPIAGPQDSTSLTSNTSPAAPGSPPDKPQDLESITSDRPRRNTLPLEARHSKPITQHRTTRKCWVYVPQYQTNPPSASQSDKPSLEQLGYRKGFASLHEQLNRAEERMTENVAKQLTMLEERITKKINEQLARFEDRMTEQLATSEERLTTHITDRSNQVHHTAHYGAGFSARAAANTNFLVHRAIGAGGAVAAGAGAYNRGAGVHRGPGMPVMQPALVGMPPHIPVVPCAPAGRGSGAASGGGAGVAGGVSGGEAGDAEVLYRKPSSGERMQDWYARTK